MQDKKIQPNDLLKTTIRFDGSNYDPEQDQKRLKNQLHRVHKAIKEGSWLTLDEIHNITKDPQASISAQLRHLRKPRFGSFNIEKRHRGAPKNGLWEYKLGEQDEN